MTMVKAAGGVQIHRRRPAPIERSIRRARLHSRRSSSRAVILIEIRQGRFGQRGLERQVTAYLARLLAASAFAALTGAALAWRRTPDVHRRLMWSAAVTLQSRALTGAPGDRVNSRRIRVHLSPPWPTTSFLSGDLFDLPTEILMKFREALGTNDC
jgi:hypothetical protein